MDSVTQAVLGASVGEAVLGKKIGNTASIVGAVIATVPDLDVLLLPFISKLDGISMHRGYSHSIVFCLLGAILFAYLLSKFKWTEEVTFWRLWLLSFMALFTHVLLDAFTTFGTQLLLPFTDWRVSFDSINIIDPVYTVPLLAGILFSVFKYEKDDKMRSIPNNLGLIVSSIYLLFTLANKQHIQREFQTQLEDQQISSYRLLTVPVKIANYTWYGVAKSEDQLFIGKYDWIEKNKILFESFPINDELLIGLDEHLVDRIKWIAQGYYVVAENQGKIRVYNMQCDMQGTRSFGSYKAPTAFYYEIIPTAEGDYELTTGMHPKN